MTAPTIALERRYMYLPGDVWTQLYRLAKQNDTNISTIINKSLAALETINDEKYPNSPKSKH